MSAIEEHAALVFRYLCGITHQKGGSTGIALEQMVASLELTPDDVLDSVKLLDKKGVVEVGRYYAALPYFNCVRLTSRGEDLCRSVATFRDAPYRAVLIGSGAVAQRPSARAVGDRGVTVGPDTETGKPVIVPVGLAYERVIGSTFSLLDQLKLNYSQAREQAAGWYLGSLISGALGLLLIGTGVVAALLGNVPAGIITAAAGVIEDSVAVLFHAQLRKANERLDTFTFALGEMQNTSNLVQIADEIDDPKVRDEAKAEIVRTALLIKNKGEAGK